MQGLYFLAMLVGVAWLCLWAGLSEEERRIWRWWPFDMAKPHQGQADTEQTAGRTARAATHGVRPPAPAPDDRGRRAAPPSGTVPWRLRGRQGRSAPPRP